MNRKKFITSWLAAFVTVFVFEWLLHGKILAGTYQVTAHLWRSEVEMEQLFHWLLIAQFLASGMFAYIFTKGYEAKGLAEGLRYGLLLGFFSVAPVIGMYAFAPYPASLVAAWFVGGMVEWCLAGVVVAAIYRRGG